MDDICGISTSTGKATLATAKRSLGLERIGPPPAGQTRSNLGRRVEIIVPSVAGTRKVGTYPSSQIIPHNRGRD